MRVPCYTKARCFRGQSRQKLTSNLPRAESTKVSNSMSHVDYDCEAKKSITFNSGFPRNMWAKLWRDAVVKRPEEAWISSGNPNPFAAWYRRLKPIMAH